jgi:hypothetical protein
MKIEHDIQAYERRNLPKNYRQASRLSNFNHYWFPAMRKQDQSLQDKDVYDLVPKRRGMTILPTKWVFDEKTDPDTGITTPRARWVVCGNFDQGSWSTQDLVKQTVNTKRKICWFRPSGGRLNQPP